MSGDDEVVGVEFRLWSTTNTRTSNGHLMVRVTLDAEVVDEELWQAVKEKLSEGLKIAAVGDFRDSLNQVLRKDNSSLERQVEALRKSNELLQENARKMRDALTVLGADLGFTAP